MSVQEEGFFFDGTRGRRLFGILHHSGRTPPRAGILYCQPFAEEQNQSHAATARAARAFAAAGFAVLRFDYGGCGDSEGELEDGSPEAWLAETAAAAEVLRRKTGISRLGVWGLRLGGWLALEHACRQAADFAILWQPVLDPAEYMDQFLRQSQASALAAGGGKMPALKQLAARLEQDEIVEVMGYPVSRGLYRGFAEVAARRPFEEAACPLLLLSLGLAEQPPARLRTRAEALLGKGRDVTLRHVREEPCWDRYWRWESPLAVEATAEWALARAAGT